MDHLDFIMAYENGDLEDDEVVAGFQKMIDDNIVWQLQGHYGRTAESLISAGLCKDTNKRFQFCNWSRATHSSISNKI